jgi:S1-C subfamily serine protease
VLRSSKWLGPLAAFLALAATPAVADTLHITSSPSGATVEIDGKTGLTPFECEYPSGYFHDPMSLLGKRLSHPITARISLAGYITKEIALTVGPREWVSMSGHKRFQYYLFRAYQFHVDLEAAGTTLTDRVSGRTSSDRSILPDLSLEELVQRAKPAVVYLKGPEKAGSGFFVTDTGVIATNAHVARGQETLTAVLTNGEQLPARVVYIDPELDIALAKVNGGRFAHLVLAEAGTVRQGEAVVAIGNPGDAMLFSVTRGIVSGVGKFSSAGPGTWIQTDAPINPGNSGGPLVNLQGEAIGINTQKLIGENVSGIGFALSASDLLAVLRKFYPEPKGKHLDLSEPTQQDERASEAAGFCTVEFTEPEGARIYVDDAFVGKAPATLKLPAGRHTIVIRSPGRADSVQSVYLFKGSHINLNPDF